MVEGVREWIWLPSEDDVFVPARIVSQDRLTVETEDGKRHQISAKDSPEIADEQCMDASIENLICLDNLNEKSILNVLRIRFKKDRIYTSVSSILVSVNPFKQLPLYTPEVMERYRKSEENKPHVFGLARDSFRAMLNDRRNQSVVISGESGSGKSESTKLILQFIAEVSEKSGASSSSLERQILEANPILEAMGNAKTVRNNNSSRFGKLISVKFDGTGSIVGGSIVEYLLEKSRVAHQAKGERNYHLFYQVLAADDSIKARLRLQAAEDYDYLNQSGVTKIQDRCEVKEYEAMVRSMKALNFSDDERESILTIVASILHLSNLRFGTDEDDGAGSCRIIAPSEESHAIASNLLGLDETALSRVLTSRMVGRRSVVLVPYKVEEAIATRNAMCKAIYGGLFKWTVDKINASLDQGKSCSTVLSVLDIFGFESFENNSFEQLCINYSNEKLQYHFNSFIFRLEEEIYRAEGIDGLVAAFEDNQPALELLEKRTTGIFAMLDEEISVPRGSDAGFLSKIIKTHDQHHPNFVKPDTKNCPSKSLQRVAFGVSHFAGVVMYNSTLFLEKNKDRLHDDVSRLVTSSTKDFVRGSIFLCDEGRKKSLGSQFKKQLVELMATLNATDPHFVRCVKPNESKIGDVFNSEMVLKQMRYSGLLEVCRIRKLGFPARRNYADFFNRYRCVDPTALDLDTLLGKLGQKNVLQEGEWVKGRTKIFLRVAQSAALEIARDAALVVVVVKIQTTSRRSLARSEYREYKRIVDVVKAAVQSRQELALTRALDQCSDLPNDGQHLSPVNQAQLLLVRIRERKLITIQKLARRRKALQDYRRSKDILCSVRAALGGSRDAKVLASVLDKCVDIPYGGKHVVTVQDAKCLLIRIQDEHRVESLIASAVCEAKKGNRCALLSAILAAESMQPPFHPDNLKEAKKLSAMFEREEDAKRHLANAVSERGSIETLTSWLQEADDLGIGEQDIVQQARILKARLLDEASTIENLVVAMQARAITDLSTAISNCEELGVDGTELKQARQLHRELLTAKIQDVTTECSMSPSEEELSTSSENASTVTTQQAAVEQLDLNVDCTDSGPDVQDGMHHLEGEDSLSDTELAVGEVEEPNESEDTTDILAPAALSESCGDSGHKCDQNFEARYDVDTKAETIPESIEGNATTSQSEMIEARSSANIVHNSLDGSDVVLRDIPDMGHATPVLSESSRASDFGDETTEPGVGGPLEKSATSMPLDMFVTGSPVERRKSLEADARPSLAAELEEDEALLVLISKALERNDNEALAVCYKKASSRGIGGNQMQRARVILERDPAVRKTVFRHEIADASIEIDRRPDPNYRFQAYGGLRPRNSYARGYLLNKTKIKDGMLKWQSTPIRRSLLELDPSENRIACGIHKSILGYTGDRSMIFPATLAQDIVRKGILDPTGTSLIRDEIYLQIMKQLTSNPSQNSVAHGWHLMCICVSSFPPSNDFRLYLVNFLVSNQSSKHSCCIRNYARYCLHTLENETRESSASVPSVEDIQTYFERPPTLATVSIVGGQVIVRNLRVTPDMNCERVCEICAHLLDLENDRRKLFGIYVYDDPCDQDRCTPRPLQNAEFIGDVVVQKARDKQSFSLVYKQKLFLASDEREDADEDDENLRELVYVQAEDDVIKSGNIVVDDEAQALELTAISLAVALGQGELLKSQLMEMKNLFSFLPPSWRSRFSVDSLSEKLIRVPLSAGTLRKRFIEIASNQRFYGTHAFYCRNVEYPEQPAIVSELPTGLVVCFDARGLELFEVSSKQNTPLHSFSYEEVYRWTGTRSTFSLYIRNQATESLFELRLSTTHSLGMGAIISDYIKIVMAERNVLNV